MTFFFKYIKQNAKLIIVLALCVFIFGLSFVLYGLPLAAVIYPAVLCLGLIFVFVVCSAVKAKEKHNTLTLLIQKPAELLGEFPKPDTMEEDDYQQLLQSCIDCIKETTSRGEQRYSNAVDYFTLWAHQIKTPIASMKLALQAEDNPSSRRQLSELSRIEQYVEMVLAYIRLDSESTDYVFRSCSVDNMVRQSVRRFSSEFIARKISLDFKETGLKIVSDEKWFCFVLEQLLSNALKYTPEGCIKIYLKEPETLCIEDTGIGIAPEDLPRIFDNGYTGGNGRLDKRASGIGLNLCKRICHNLGIEISAESEPRRGSIFMLKLSQYEIKG